MSAGDAGTDWTEAQNDLIVADYFAMLANDLAGRHYVKSDHNAALQQLTGRSRGSIERKHMNISAVMGRLGMPRIAGYAPYANFQAGLIEAISRYLSDQDELIFGAATVATNAVAESRSDWRGPEVIQASPTRAIATLAGYENPPVPSPDDFKSSVALGREPINRIPKAALI